jgi:hypothetical protein
LARDYKVSDFLPLYKELTRLKIPFVIVGGQAVNLWASTYEPRVRALRALRPFTSRDLDLYTDSQEAVVKAAEALHCKRTIPGPDNADVVIGALWLPKRGHDPALVQFLNGTFGIKDSSEIFKTREEYYWEEEDLKLSVMHPVLTLESKLACVHEPCRSKNRNDLRHLRMACEYVPYFIEDAVLENDARSVLRMIARIKRLCLSVRGTLSYFDHNVEIERTIPIEQIAKSSNGRLQKFLKTEWPLMQEQISRKREKEWHRRSGPKTAG